MDLYGEQLRFPQDVFPKHYHGDDITHPAVRFNLPMPNAENNQNPRMLMMQCRLETADYLWLVHGGFSPNW